MGGCFWNRGEGGVFTPLWTMRRDFIFDCVNLHYCKCHRINFKCGGSCIDYQHYIKKQTTINPKNNDNKYFQHAATIVLNHEKIKSHPERLSNNKPFINNYNWEGINYSSKNKDWKRFEKNNPTMLPMFGILKGEKYVLLVLKKLIQIEKNK